MAAYSAYTDIKIGQTVGALTAVTGLGSATCPPPRTQFVEAVEVAEMADHSIKALGNPVIIWTFANIKYAARAALRAYIVSGLSDALFISSPDASGDIQNYACTAQWPYEGPNYLAFEWIDELVLTFRNCVEQ